MGRLLVGIVLALIGWSGAANAAPKLKLPRDWARKLAAGKAHLVGVTADGNEDTAPSKLKRQLTLADEDDQLSIAVTDCHAAVAELRARGKVLVLESGGHRVEAGGGRVTADGRVLIDIAGELCDGPLEYHTDGRDITLGVVSLIGPLLTVSVFHSEWLAGGPPYHGERWQVFDVRTGRPVDLLDVVDEGSLLAALRADPYVAQRFSAASRARLAAATTWTEALGALTAELNHQGFTAFGIAAYDPSSGRADLRLGFTADGCGMCPNEVKKLGLRVEVRRRWRPAFAAAHAGDGRFAGRDVLPIP